MPAWLERLGAGPGQTRRPHDRAGASRARLSPRRSRTGARGRRCSASRSSIPRAPSSTCPCGSAPGGWKWPEAGAPLPQDALALSWALVLDDAGAGAQPAPRPSARGIGARPRSRALSHRRRPGRLRDFGPAVRRPARATSSGRDAGTVRLPHHDLTTCGASAAPRSARDTSAGRLPRGLGPRCRALRRRPAVHPLRVRSGRSVPLDSHRGNDQGAAVSRPRQIQGSHDHVQPHASWILHAVREAETRPAGEQSVA